MLLLGTEGRYSCALAQSELLYSNVTLNGLEPNLGLLMTLHGLTALTAMRSLN